MARINLTDAFLKALRCERGQKVTEVRDVVAGAEPCSSPNFFARFLGLRQEPLSFRRNNYCGNF